MGLWGTQIQYVYYEHAKCKINSYFFFYMSWTACIHANRVKLLFKSLNRVSNLNILWSGESGSRNRIQIHFNIFPFLDPGFHKAWKPNRKLEKKLLTNNFLISEFTFKNFFLPSYHTFTLALCKEKAESAYHTAWLQCTCRIQNTNMNIVRSCAWLRCLMVSVQSSPTGPWSIGPSF